MKLNIDKLVRVLAQVLVVAPSRVAVATRGAVRDGSMLSAFSHHLPAHFSRFRFLISGVEGAGRFSIYGSQKSLFPTYFDSVAKCTIAPVPRVVEG